MNVLRQVLATEGFVDDTRIALRDFLNQEEREFQDEVVSDTNNIKKIKKLSAQLEGRGGPREDAKEITLSAWAKWLVVTDTVVTDAGQLTHEVERLTHLVETFGSVWIDHYVQVLNDCAKKVYGQTSADEARHGMKEVLSNFYPRGFDTLLTTKQHYTPPYGHALEVQSSEPFLGLGTVIKYPMGPSEAYGYQVRLGEEGKRRDGPTGAAFAAFSAEQLRPLLAAVEKLSEADKKMMDHKRVHTAQDHVFDEFIKFEMADKSGDTDELHELYKNTDFIVEADRILHDLSRQVNHVVQVILRACDKSLRQLKHQV